MPNLVDEFWGSGWCFNRASELQSGLSAAIVAAWQAGAISRDTMTELFRRGEVLPEGRTTEEEKLIGRQRAAAQTGGSLPPDNRSYG